MPMALKAVGATLAKRPNQSALHMLRRLNDASRRLRITQMEAPLQLSYDNLSDASRLHLQVRCI